MKFMLTFTVKPETKGRDEANARFKKTGGQPPKGVKLLGRWIAADFSGGFDLLESDDATALTEFALMWSDLMELRVVPVLEDAEVKEAVQRAGMQRQASRASSCIDMALARCLTVCIWTPSATARKRL